MKRALITGGSGFIGANLIRRLLTDGHEVHALMRPGFRPWRIDELRDEIAVHQGQIDDVASVAAVLSASRPDWIFHLAAHGAYSWQTNLHEMIRANIVGTTTLLQGALKIGFDSFVHAGSSSEYGFKDHAPDETEHLEPNSDYAVTKASATLYCAYEARKTGAPITSLRLYSAYGPWEEASRLIPSIALHGLDGRLPVLAGPAVARDFVYVDDVVDAFLLAAGRQDGSSPIYNIASGAQTTLADVVQIARAQLGIGDEPVWASMPDRAWDTDTWVGDPGRANNELGWHARIGLQQGFRLFVEWLQSSTELMDGYRDASHTRH